MIVVKRCYNAYQIISVISQLKLEIKILPKEFSSWSIKCDYLFDSIIKVLTSSRLKSLIRIFIPLASLNCFSKGQRKMYDLINWYQKADPKDAALKDFLENKVPIVPLRPKNKASLVSQLRRNFSGHQTFFFLFFSFCISSPFVEV